VEQKREGEREESHRSPRWMVCRTYVCLSVRAPYVPRLAFIDAWADGGGGAAGERKEVACVQDKNEDDAS
jgi:hypothetical protein